MKKNTTTGMAAIAVISLALATQAFAYTTISASLDLGERNNDVTNLQTFFADNASIYPEGLVTGYFGTMSRNAVQRFQMSKGIVSSGSAATTGYGRVGPSTRDAINGLINSGGWSGGVSVSGDVSGPAFYNVAQNQTNTSATFNFSTNENTMSRVVYSTYPLMFNEGDINSNGFGPIGGMSVNSGNGMAVSHSVTLSSLQPNTLYYYTIISSDAAGNISVVGPNNTFRTNQ